jgi:hypothetical protein
MTTSAHTLTWVVGIVMLGFVGLWLWQSGREERSVRTLDDAERHALFTRTLETLRTTCAAHRDAELTGFCAEQAQFVLRFSECDAACHDLARSQLRPATR